MRFMDLVNTLSPHTAVKVVAVEGWIEEGTAIGFASSIDGGIWPDFDIEYITIVNNVVTCYAKCKMEEKYGARYFD